MIRYGIWNNFIILELCLWRRIVKQEKCYRSRVCNNNNNNLKCTEPEKGHAEKISYLVRTRLIFFCMSLRGLRKNVIDNAAQKEKRSVMSIWAKLWNIRMLLIFRHKTDATPAIFFARFCCATLSRDNGAACNCAVAPCDFCRINKPNEHDWLWYSCW